MTGILMNLFLQKRHYTPNYLSSIRNNHHPLLLNIDYACQLLKDIHDKQEKIVIMPDFDTDGISAGTLGLAGMSELGFNVSRYTPDNTKGYGIHVSDVKKVIQQFPDVKWIITCDVGITCYDAFLYAYKHGLKVIVTDHHEEKEDKPVAKYTEVVNGKKVTVIGTNQLLCETIVNPCQLKETYPLRDICGAYVLWQVLSRYSQLYTNSFLQEQIWRLRLFAGMGTIGDLMRLINENRVLVNDAVSLFKFIYNYGDSSVVDLLPGNPIYKEAFRGMFNLLVQMNDNSSISQIDEKFMGWTMAPTFNSAKRLGMSMAIVFGIFTFTNNDDSIQNAHLLVMANENRKVMVKQYKAQIKKEEKANQQKMSPYIYFTDAPGGVLGLLANQFDEISGKPTFVLNRQTLSGSGRSFDYFPVITKTKHTEFENLINGHEEAFGIHFDSMNQVKRFYQFLCQVVPPLYEKFKDKLIPYDLTLGLGEFNLPIDREFHVSECFDFVRESQHLKPFGAGFAEPRIRIVFNPQDATIKTMGSSNQHLKIVLPNQVELISWNNAQMRSYLLDKKEAEFIGNFAINNFGGLENLQMIGNVMVKKDEEEEIS